MTPRNRIFRGLAVASAWRWVKAQCYPMTLTTSGKLMLSRMDGQSAKALLETDVEYRAMSEAKRRAFLRQLETVRGTELLKAESGLRNGIIDIAVPSGLRAQTLSLFSRFPVFRTLMRSRRAQPCGDARAESTETRGLRRDRDLF